MFDPARVHLLPGIRPQKQFLLELIPGTLKFGSVVQIDYQGQETKTLIVVAIYSSSIKGWAIHPFITIIYVVLFVIN